MEMKRVTAGKLRAIGYDPKQRLLRVEMDDGNLIDYTGVGEAIWQRLATSSSAWSYYRDNIEEEFSSRRADRTDSSGPKSNPLDSLFGK